MGDPAAGVLEEPPATLQTLRAAKGEPTVDDELAALKGRSTNSPVAGELAVTAVAQAVTSPIEEDAAIVPITETPPPDEPNEATGRLTEPEGDAIEPVDAGGELATADGGAIESGSSETAELTEAATSAPTSDGITLAAEPDAIERAAVAVPGATTLPVDLSLVHFDLSSSHLSPGAVMMINRAAAALDGLDSPFSVEIKGFTDTVGSDEFNLWLASDVWTV